MIEQSTVLSTDEFIFFNFKRQLNLYETEMQRVIGILKKYEQFSENHAKDAYKEFSI